VIEKMNLLLLMLHWMMMRIGKEKKDFGHACRWNAFAGSRSHFAQWGILCLDCGCLPATPVIERDGETAGKALLEGSGKGRYSNYLAEAFKHH